MADYLGWTNGVMHWDVFNRSVQDWEVGTLYSFMGLLYSLKIGGVRKIACVGPYRDSCLLCLYYQVLSPTNVQSFPWRSIWSVKAPLRVAFFLWTATRGQILTLDNSRKCQICIVEWCYV